MLNFKHFSWQIIIKMWQWIFILMLSRTVIAAHDDVCKKITKFEAICIKHNTIFILATHPCKETDYVNLVISRPAASKSDAFFFSHEYHRKEDDIINTLIGGTNHAVSLDMHKEQEGNLHVTLSSNATKEEGGGVILDVIFNIKPERCIGFFPLHFVPQKPFNSEYCHNINKEAINRKASICHHDTGPTVISVLEVCSSPYRLHVYVYGNGINFHQIFTEADNKFYPIKVSGTLGGNCGFILEKFYSTGFPLQRQHVKLIRHCRSTNKNDTYVDTTYYTSYGMMCGHHNCTKIGMTEHQCFDPMLKFDLKQQCSGDYKLKIDSKFINFTDMTLADDMVKMPAKLSKQSTKEMFGIESESFINYTVLLKAAHFTLLSDLLVLVNTNDFSFPLFRDEFHALAHTACPSNHEKHVSLALKVLIPLIFLVTLAVICYVCYKRHLKRKSIPYNQSLPYQIDLGEDDEFPMES